MFRYLIGNRTNILIKKWTVLLISTGHHMRTILSLALLASVRATMRVLEGPEGADLEKEGRSWSSRIFCPTQPQGKTVALGGQHKQWVLQDSKLSHTHKQISSASISHCFDPAKPLSLSNPHLYDNNLTPLVSTLGINLNNSGDKNNALACLCCGREIRRWDALGRAGFDWGSTRPLTHFT